MATERSKPNVLSVQELASRWGIALSTAYKALSRGSVPHMRVGSRFIIPLHAVEALEARTVPRAEEVISHPHSVPRKPRGLVQ